MSLALTTALPLRLRPAEPVSSTSRLQPLRARFAEPVKFALSARLVAFATLMQTQLAPVQGACVWVCVCWLWLLTTPTVRALITTGVLISTREKSCCGDCAMITSKAAALPACVPATGGLFTCTQAEPAPGALTLHSCGERQVLTPFWAEHPAA